MLIVSVLVIISGRGHEGGQCLMKEDYGGGERFYLEGRLEFFILGAFRSSSHALTSAALTSSIKIL